MRSDTGCFIAAATLVAALVGNGCASGPSTVVDESGVDLMLATRVYTLVNLHPDQVRGRLYAVNYQQAGLIPRCSEVDLLEISGRSMRFRVAKTDREYTYYYHKAAVEPFDQHLLKYFGTSCDEGAARSLGKADQEGIRTGKASPGMTRQGVIYAIGYPPPHVTPDIDADEWTYWNSRFDRMIVVFDAKGVVSEIRE